ncbi:lipoprotein [Spiroplasma cantharicola]|uniref:Bifunctional chitinase/lysozyme n=1 Tax=Spiroplasma cantharicola TaxID=362837 RepID=A0A0M3SJ79_9MOLU|nr:lipoprotein [Spiroplasma cantharicola]ALD66264.1 bifunctional chitinase/lysozyme [Spiroplasma cantharicola]
MKKLLNLLASTTLVVSAGGSVVACTNVMEAKDKTFETGDKWTGNGNISNEIITKKQNSIKKQISKSLLTDDTSKKTLTYGKIDPKDRSSLANKEILKVNKEFVFSPYADMGIVEDTAEYLMKDKGKSQGTRDEAEKSLNGKNIIYNDLGEIAGNKNVITENSEITLGFMQNAADTGDLVPMWNAGPSKGDGKGILAKEGEETEYAKWFNDRYRDWTKKSSKNKIASHNNGGNLNPENVRISFGPFANSLWHSAWENNKTPEELAQVIKAVGDKYGTKKFDFYFASPYLTRQGSYLDSQILLASALKILIESDSSYDFQLSLVMSTKDGVALHPGFGDAGNNNLNLLGDEIYPLYNFTKYLGMNFRLNLVTQALTVPNDAHTDKDWELKVIQDGAEQSAINWNKINEVTNGDNKGTPFTKQRIKITPWIGRRAEAAAYNFTPKDAAQLRTWAVKEGFGGLGMFYISRDVPSHYEDNGLEGPAQADRNALDQNIRSGSGFKQFTYAEALNGKLSENEIPEEIRDKDEIISKLKAIDYKKDIQENKALDQLENGGSWEGPSWEGGGGISNPGPGAGNGGGEAILPPTGQGKSLYTKWSDANPNRKSSITKKAKANKSTYFSPYLDAGLYEGNNMQNITSSVNGLDHLTLAFVQQVNNHSNHLDLSIAGTATGDEAYDWWESSQLWDKILKPIADKNQFENIKVAYGGATTGGFTEKNPWTLANKLNENNPAKAKADLKEALIGYQDSLVKLAAKKGKKVNMPKAIDFDIEGHAQELDEDNRLLAATIAEMKKEDKAWDFSLTLPVLPSGLTSVGYRVMNIFVEEFKKAGLSEKDLPVVNLMLMDYGDPIYVQAIKDGLTNFDLARQAVNATKNNLATSIEKNYGKVSIGNQGLYKLIGATPMIGVNDTVWGVFTEEDAKELYNWSHTVGLGYIGMWSMNDDRGLDVHSKKPVNKSLLTHGLAYLEEYDFARAFAGDWTKSLKNPKPEHKIIRRK